MPILRDLEPEPPTPAPRSWAPGEPPTPRARRILHEATFAPCGCAWKTIELGRCRHEAP